MIPNEVIEKVLDKTDIVELISSYLPLKRAGQNFRALCPFHKEKTPSFMVNPSKQIYHCFGCGKGGNAISFLMQHEKMDFIESIKILADKANIALPSFQKSDRPANSLADKLYAANAAACDFYEKNLREECGKPAYQYFIQRGLTERTIKLFKLGYAPDLWQGLINHCRDQGVETDILEKAGLVLKSQDGGNRYDRFRNRATFPIFDIRNKPLGFGARALDDSLPKYINSPETYVYTKGKHLYGLNFSREHIRKQNYVIIVEGYFDLILPFQNDVKNVVATLGTALTTEQVGILKRLTKNAIIVYDSDKAGEKATLRGLDLLIEEEMNVRIAILPKGSDPDSFVRKEGKTGFMKALKESKDLFDYKLGTLTARFKKNEPHGKTKIVAEMLPTLARIKNAVLKSSYLKKMSEELAVDEESIRAELGKVKAFPRESQPAAFEAPPGKKVSLAEITLLGLAIEDEKSAIKIQKDFGFENFKSKPVAEILKKIEELYKAKRKVSCANLVSFFNNKEMEELISEAVCMIQTTKDKEKVLSDCFKNMKKISLKETLGDVQAKIREAESARDPDRVLKLMSEYSKLIKDFTKEEPSLKK